MKGADCLNVTSKTFHIDSKDDLTNEKLIELIKQHRLLCGRYQELKDLYTSDHPILHAAVKDAYKPDNRLVVNYAKYITDTLNGFFIGIPVKVHHENEIVSDYVHFIESYNNIDDNNAELSKKCSIYGHAFELLYMDEEAQVGICQIDPSEAFIVYDNSIRERPLYGIRYRVVDGVDIEGSISDDRSIMYFSIRSGKLVYTEIKENYFGAVPIIEYVENEERQGAYENVETLINAYNKAISEKANDVDYFADAYMKIIGALLNEETIKRIRDNRIINLGESSENVIVEFMQKPNADQSQENFINRLDKLIFSIAMVANINDENFGTSSGIAMKYKLQSMSNLVKVKERKFTKGFNRRFRLISNLPNSKFTSDDVYRLKYTFTRNIPNNLAEEAETASILQSIVSKETAIETLSMVSDVKTEMARIEEEHRISSYDYELDR